MLPNLTFGNFTTRLRAFIDCPNAIGSPSQQGFNQLAHDLFCLQFEHNEPYRRFCQARGVIPETVDHWTEIPAVPTAAFKEHTLSCLPAEQRMIVFHSSGTTQQRPSRNFHSLESLGLYEAALLPWFFANLLPEMRLQDIEACGQAHCRYQFLALMPPPQTAPHSSLVHMCDTVHRELGQPDPGFLGQIGSDGAWKLELAQIEEALTATVQLKKPVLLLATAFSLVHLLEHLATTNLSFDLPAGSRVMETGGYKGRSRTLSKADLHAQISSRLAIPPSHFVCEYGMSELSSQAYAGRLVAGPGVSAEGKAADTMHENPPSRSQKRPESGLQAQSMDRELVYSFPYWARAQVVSAETGTEAREGDTGLLRIFDLANAYSVMAIQTEDLAIKRGRGFELIGRAPLAETRGCSLMAVGE